VTKYFSKTTLW